MSVAGDDGTQPIHLAARHTRPPRRARVSTNSKFIQPSPKYHISLRIKCNHLFQVYIYIYIYIYLFIYHIEGAVFTTIWCSMYKVQSVDSRNAEKEKTNSLLL